MTSDIQTQLYLLFFEVSESIAVYLTFQKKILSRNGIFGKASSLELQDWNPKESLLKSFS